MNDRLYLSGIRSDYSMCNTFIGMLSPRLDRLIFVAGVASTYDKVRFMQLVTGYVNPFSAGTVFRRQNLTSIDVRF